MPKEFLIVWPYKTLYLVDLLRIGILKNINLTGKTQEESEAYILQQCLFIEFCWR